MVSSFIISTNIKVSKQIADLFNQIREIDVESIDESEFSSIPVYFDQGYMNDVDSEFFEKWIASSSHHGSFHPYCQNWVFNDDNVLVDECEKFHGAIGMLHYFINTFFEPRGVKLNGTVVGANDSNVVAYVYNVKDNVITMDIDATRVLVQKCDQFYKANDYIAKEIVDNFFKFYTYTDYSESIIYKSVRKVKKSK